MRSSCLLFHELLVGAICGYGFAMPIRVTVWNEFRHERNNPKVAGIYPNGIHERIASHLRTDPTLDISTATLDEPQQGLSDKRLNANLPHPSRSHRAAGYSQRRALGRPDTGERAHSIWQA